METEDRELDPESMAIGFEFALRLLQRSGVTLDAVAAVRTLAAVADGREVLTDSVSKAAAELAADSILGAATAEEWAKVLDGVGRKHRMLDRFTATRIMRHIRNSKSGD